MWDNSALLVIAGIVRCCCTVVPSSCTIGQEVKFCSVLSCQVSSMSRSVLIHDSCHTLKLLKSAHTAICSQGKKSFTLPGNQHDYSILIIHDIEFFNPNNKFILCLNSPNQLVLVETQKRTWSRTCPIVDWADVPRRSHKWHFLTKKKKKIIHKSQNVSAIVVPMSKLALGNWEYCFSPLGGMLMHCNNVTPMLCSLWFNWPERDDLGRHFFVWGQSQSY